MKVSESDCEYNVNGRKNTECRTEYENELLVITTTTTPTPHPPEKKKRCYS
jgi:hypothetical protein